MARSMQFPKLSENSKPILFGEDLVKQFTTVTMTSITIDITSTQHTRRTITYTQTPRFPKRNHDNEHKIVHDCGNNPLVLSLDESDYGSTYEFLVVASSTETGLPVEIYQFSVRAELNKAEMKAYLENILKRVDPWSKTPAYFYRNYTEADEKRIIETNEGCFELIRKERSGHRSSPLYRRLHNITYFSCKLFKNIDSEQLDYLPYGFVFPYFSPFGGERAAFRASTILSDDSVMFLGGMHCYDNEGRSDRPHYITVVICHKGSLSYHQCMDMELLELPLENNPILQWEKSTDRLTCANKLKIVGDQEHGHEIWPEIILCDRSISLDLAKLSTCDYTPYNCAHQSSLKCKTCHGYRKKNDEDEDEEHSNGSGDSNVYGGSFIDDEERTENNLEEEEVDQSDQEEENGQVSRSISPDMIVHRKKKSKKNERNKEEEEEDEGSEDEEEVAEDEDEEYLVGTQEAVDADEEENEDETDGEDSEDTDEEDEDEDEEEEEVDSSQQPSSSVEIVVPKGCRIVIKSNDGGERSSQNSRSRSSKNARKRKSTENDPISSRTRRKSK